MGAVEMATQAEALASRPAAASLNVIALVSGGKDGFFALAHCVANGHRIIALANLYPAASERRPGSGGGEGGGGGNGRLTSPRTSIYLPDDAAAEGLSSNVHGPGEDENDLNSFMYQTVGHEVLPLYASATGIPLYRHPIVGTSTQRARDYEYDGEAGAASAKRHHVHSDMSRQLGSHDEPSPQSGLSGLALVASAKDYDTDRDETESMVPLLRAIMADHPEANAVSAGAILSTYQRTRVESVATRLGLVPLAYLWKFPVLPSTDLQQQQQQQQTWSLASTSEAGPGVADRLGDERDDAQLLRDMAGIGLEARIIKVASGAMDESDLWRDVTAPSTISRFQRAIGRFGAVDQGAVLGEGGEFETLVVDGPAWLFKRKIVVAPGDCKTVQEGGGTAWLKLSKPRLEAKPEVEDSEHQTFKAIPRIPAMLDARFVASASSASKMDAWTGDAAGADITGQQGVPFYHDEPYPILKPVEPTLQTWCFLASAGAENNSSIEAQTRSVVTQIKNALLQRQLPASAVISTVILLRNMSTFSRVNAQYGSLFPHPNPPSRITVACGALSPATKDIAIYLNVHVALEDAGDRQGLHVQSRSYWAPANIGPYSQAVAVPVPCPRPQKEQHDGLRSSATLVTIAGQIPLGPATMELLPSEKRSQTVDLALSLQHLWRIGEEMKAQWWTSVVAFFPACGDPSVRAMRRKSRLAARAWTAAHLWSRKTGDDDETGDSASESPDVWDRKYNSAYRQFGDNEASQDSLLPDWSVLGPDLTEPTPATVPPCFAAEVDELPRGASVEWQAHFGLAGLRPNSVRTWTTHKQARLRNSNGGEENTRERCGCTLLVNGDSTFFLHVVISFCCFEWTDDFTRPNPEYPVHVRELRSSLQTALRSTLCDFTKKYDPELVPDKSRTLTTLYLDATRVVYGADDIAGDSGSPIIPCRSLWDADGKRLFALAVFQQAFVKKSGDD